MLNITKHNCLKRLEQSHIQQAFFTYSNIFTYRYTYIHWQPSSLVKMPPHKAFNCTDYIRPNSHHENSLKLLTCINSSWLDWQPFLCVFTVNTVTSSVKDTEVCFVHIILINIEFELQYSTIYCTYSHNYSYTQTYRQ